MKKCRDNTKNFCTQQEFVPKKRLKKKGYSRKLESKTFYLVGYW